MKRALLLVVVAALAAVWVWCSQDTAQLRASPRAAAAKEKGSAKMEKATFGGGCFWGVEATFRQLKGVTATAVGYEGGNLEHPSYHDVCTDRTGHAEVVQVEYDPSRISYEQLLEVFWKNHDPTTPQPPGPRRRHAVSLGRLLSLPATEAGGRRHERAVGQESHVSPTHRHRDRSGRDILAGGRLSPAIPGEARPVDLPHPLTRHSRHSVTWYSRPRL